MPTGMRQIGAALLGLAAAGLLAIFTARAAPAADRFAETLGVAAIEEPAAPPLSARAWTALAGLGSDAELGLAIGRPTLERAVGDALAAAAIEARPLEGATLTLGGHRLLAGPQSMRLVLEGKLDGGYFAAGLVATAILEPVADADGIGFVARDVAARLGQATLKRTTLNPAATAAKAEPVVRAGEAQLEAILAEAARGLALPLRLAGAEKSAKGAAKKPAIAAAAFMLDAEGFYAIGRLSAAPKVADDALLTGSLASAGLTAEQYRAAFNAVRAKTVGAAAAAGTGELVVPLKVLGAVVGDASATSCATAPVETDPVAVSATTKLAEPPAAPGCRKIAESCAARELCGRESECADRVVERTVQETVKVPFQREICRQREYVCYGWGPYGCAYGESVCVAPDRITDYREKVVERVVGETVPAESNACQALRDLKSRQPGACSQSTATAAAEPAECGLVTGGGLSACEAKASLVGRMRSKREAQLGARLVARGRIEACVTRSLGADLSQAKLSTIGSGRADLVAEVSVRPEGRGDDGELTCQLGSGPAFKAPLKVKFEKAGRAPVGLVSREGKLFLASAASREQVKIAVDRTAVEAVVAGNLGYRCTIAGGVAGAPFASWESRVGGPLRDMLMKAGSVSATIVVPAMETELSTPELLGRPALARVDGDRVIFSAATE